MGEIVLVRHGETQWSKEGRHTGLSDIELTDTGRAQAEALRPVLAQLTVALVLVSPLIRCRLTAELAGLPSAQVDPDLAEWDYGGYEGISTEEIQRDRPDWYLWRDGVPSGDGEHPGESLEQVGARLDRVLARAAAALADGDVVLVSHGHASRVLGARWIGLPPSYGGALALSTAARCVLGHEHGRPVLTAWNLAPPAQTTGSSSGAVAG